MLYSAKVLVAQNKSVPWSSFSYLHSCSLELSCLEPSIFECVSSNSPVIQVLWTFQNWIVTYTYKHVAAFHSQPCKWMLLFNKNICQNFLKENVKLKWFLYFKPRFYHPSKPPHQVHFTITLGAFDVYIVDMLLEGMAITELCQFQGCTALLVHCKGTTFNFKKINFQ